jgi:membrane protein involved in colicin uptake
MISPKWAVLVAAFALVGVIGLPTTAFAQDDESQEAEVEIERNNEISQSIEQKQEASTNEAEAEIDDDDFVDLFGENEIEQNQANVCDVTQSQAAQNNAAIVDFSTNTFDINQILARLNLGGF